MSLLARRIQRVLTATFSNVFPVFGRFWQAHLRRKAARASLKTLLDRSDDHLLQDVGIDRETALRLLGEMSKAQNRGWERWQG